MPSLTIVTHETLFRRGSQLFCVDSWSSARLQIFRQAGFSTIHLIGRDSPPPLSGWGHPLEGPGLQVSLLPAWRGPLGLARRARATWRALTRALPAQGPVLLSLPSLVGFLAWLALRPRPGRPRLLHVISDPWAFLAPGAFRHPLRALWRLAGRAGLRSCCAQAEAVWYVTEGALQQRYPTRQPSLGCSDVSLPLADPGPPLAQRPARAVFVGGLAPYKGLEVLLQALALCRQAGCRVPLDLVDCDGAQTAVAQRGLSDQVAFLPRLPQPDLWRLFRERRLFLLPSLAEGTPRALLEAMACGCAALGSAVGDVPRWLPPEALLPPGCPRSLADALRRLWAVSEPVSPGLLTLVQQQQAIQAARPPQGLERAAAFLYQVTR